MTINELREKRNQAWNAAKAFVETKRDKDGLLSEEDAKKLAERIRRHIERGCTVMHTYAHETPVRMDVDIRR